MSFGKADARVIVIGAWIVVLLLDLYFSKQGWGAPWMVTALMVCAVKLPRRLVTIVSLTTAACAVVAMFSWLFYDGTFAFGRLAVLVASVIGLLLRKPIILPETIQPVTSDTLDLLPTVAGDFISVQTDFEAEMVEPQMTISTERQSGERILSLLAYDEAKQAKVAKLLKSKTRSLERALKMLIDRNLITNFQALHLLWGRENYLNFANFLLIRVIGKGGSSTVYEAYDRKNKMTVALKVLSHAEHALSRFNREMASIQKLAHPNIVVAYEVGEFRHRAFIAMEYFVRGDLGRYVREEGTLSEQDALRYVLQIANGLEQSHRRQILHRDVKPGNMLLSEDGKVKLSDLGLSRAVDRVDEDESFETANNSLAGTLEFMAPEQAVSFRDADERADIYGLGSSLFYLLTGRSRLIGESFAERIKNLTLARRFRDLSDYCANPEIVDLVNRLCAFDVQDRIPTAHEATNAIRAVLENLDDESHSEIAVQVLIVEDDKDDLFLAMRYLGEINRCLRITEARSLAEAISVTNARGKSFDVVLLDLNLPDSSGVETIKEMRKLSSEMAIIAMTGINDVDFGLKCIAAGATEYLPKSNASAEVLERRIFVSLSRMKAAISIAHPFDTDRRTSFGTVVQPRKSRKSPTKSS
jgi:serine/threonine protein kinase